MQFNNEMQDITATTKENPKKENKFHEFMGRLSLTYETSKHEKIPILNRIALIDLLGTILVCGIIAQIWNVSFWKTTLIALVFGDVTHKLLNVHTNSPFVY